MLATSDGLTVARPKFLDKALRKIKLLQRKLKQKTIGSNKWHKLQHRSALLLFKILEYVCSRTDTYFAKVNKDYTSKTCPNCGTHTGKKDLSLRLHICPECHYSRDRDIAASEVVRNRGLELITAVGTTVVKQPSNGVLAGASA